MVLAGRLGAGLGLSVSPLLTQSLVHVPAARAAEASGLLTTTVQLGQLLGVTVIGSVYLSRAAVAPGADSGAMSVAACWLAALSTAGLLAAMIMPGPPGHAGSPLVPVRRGQPPFISIEPVPKFCGCLSLPPGPYVKRRSNQDGCSPGTGLPHP